MAVLTAQGISGVALELLTRMLVLPRTVASVPGTEFAGANGDTITVRVRLPRTAKVQETPGSAIETLLDGADALVGIVEDWARTPASNAVVIEPAV